jgi:hypothetical protein
MEHVDRPPLPLRARGTAPLPGAAPARFERIGLGGVLDGRGERGRQMHAAQAPGALVARSWRWNLRDRWSNRWWPQGVAIGSHVGSPVALVSWFAQGGRGARVTVVDLRDARRPRYRHVELVTVEPDGALAPVPIHAGGIAWTPDGARLYAAATFGGIREFRLADLARAGRRLVLPQHAEFAAEGEPRERLRYSFVSAAEASDTDEISLVAGEYRRDGRGRIARLRVDDDRAEIVELFRPGIAAMQGVALDGDRWSISASRGDRADGDLWQGPRDALVRQEGALPVGPEDLAHDAAGRLWGVSEFPGRRWLYELSATTASAAGAAR